MRRSLRCRQPHKIFSRRYICKIPRSRRPCPAAVRTVLHSRRQSRNLSVLLSFYRLIAFSEAWRSGTCRQRKALQITVLGIDAIALLYNRDGPAKPAVVYPDIALGIRLTGNLCHIRQFDQVFSLRQKSRQLFRQIVGRRIRRLLLALDFYRHSLTLAVSGIVHGGNLHLNRAGKTA